MNNTDLFIQLFAWFCRILCDEMRHTADSTEIGKKVWLFAKLQPGRARKRINAT